MKYSSHGAISTAIPEQVSTPLQVLDPAVGVGARGRPELEGAPVANRRVNGEATPERLLRGVTVDALDVGEGNRACTSHEISSQAPAHCTRTGRGKITQQKAYRECGRRVWCGWARETFALRAFCHSKGRSRGARL